MLKLKKAKFYKAKEGQTLQQIAEAYGLPESLLVKENALTHPIFAGQILSIPQADGNLYTVQMGDNACLLSGSEEAYEKKNGVKTLYPGMKVFL